MASSTIYGKPVLAFTEQHASAPNSGSESVPLPLEFWAVLILSLVLFVLLAWRAIDEIADCSSGDDKVDISNFPPF
jgi:hypothetical protein